MDTFADEDDVFCERVINDLDKTLSNPVNAM